jgi:hypothetical protein
VKRQAVGLATGGNHPGALRVASVGGNGNWIRRDQRHEIHKFIDWIFQGFSPAIIKMQGGTSRSRQQPGSHEEKKCLRRQQASHGFDRSQDH